METEQIFDINAMNTCQWCGGLVVMSNIPLFWCQSKSAKAKEKNCIQRCLCSFLLNCANLFTRRLCTLQMYMLKIRRVNKVFEPAKFSFRTATSCSILIEHAVLSCAFGAQKEFHSYGLIIKVCYWVYLNRHYNQLTSHAFHFSAYRLTRLLKKNNKK